MPSVLEHNEKMVIMINEEDQDKVKKELLVWVANNLYSAGLHKYILRDGHFSKDVLDKLRKAAKYLEELKERRNITIVPFEKYTVKAAIKVIKKYSSMGVRLFVLDTLKESSDSRDTETWKSMERDMVDLYDVVKPAAKNVALFVILMLKMQRKMEIFWVRKISRMKNTTLIT